mgnify:FL=1
MEVYVTPEELDQSVADKYLFVQALVSLTIFCLMSMDLNCPCNLYHTQLSLIQYGAIVVTASQAIGVALMG